MKDINGIELQVGDNVAMAITEYERARMIHGTVTKIDLRKNRGGIPTLCVSVNKSRYTFNPETNILKL